MRAQIIEKLEVGRVRYGQFASVPGSGPCGLFFVQGPCGCELKISGLVRPSRCLDAAALSELGRDVLRQRPVLG